MVPVAQMIALLSVWLALVATLISPAVAKEYVDLELVLAVDVSLSMDRDEQRLQRDGYVAAFRDPKLITAAQSGPNGRIAVTYVEWAGAGIQSVVIPWRLIKTSRDANAFADELAAKPIKRAMMTSISEVVSFSSDLFKSSPVQGLRRVIDVSGDGPNNSGRPVELARNRVVGKGIVINGLAIRLKKGIGAYSYFDLPDLDHYYRDCVIGGSGSFVLSIRDKAEFATAIRQKLLLEIAGLTPIPAASLQRTSWRLVADKYDCLIGEKMWQQYRDGREDW
ncbi:MAG: hypothetical protein ACI89J_000371 [Hyphomicrobiaceae bacterium]|jgi:hypothetical protein